MGPWHLNPNVINSSLKQSQDNQNFDLILSDRDRKEAGLKLKKNQGWKTKKKRAENEKISIMIKINTPLRQFHLKIQPIKCIYLTLSRRFDF